MALVLTGIMLFGLLAYFAILFFLNRYYPSPAIFSYPTEAEKETAIALRLTWRSRGEGIQRTCIELYALGGWILLYRIFRNWRTMELRSVVLFFAGTAAAMAVCLLPFALLDRSCFSDYLFPVRGAIIVVGVLFLAAVILELLKKKR